MARSRVELFEQIRKDRRVDGTSIRELADRHWVHRRTVRQALESAVPPPRKSYPPGAEAEVDFGEFHAMIAGAMLKLWLFVLRLSCSGRAFHVAFATQAQEAFLEGHVLAFEHFGAAPARIRYDNLKPAVTRVLRGRDRAEAERFVALTSSRPAPSPTGSPPARPPACQPANPGPNA